MEAIDPELLGDPIFVRERGRLLAVLGELTDGGIVEASAHVGSTSVPGLEGDPCIDIGLAVWPLPIDPGRAAGLESLGYQAVPGFEGAPDQRFRHASGQFQLLAVEAGSEAWTEYRLLRDYLRSDERSRRDYHTRRQKICHDAASEPEKSALRSALFAETVWAARRWSITVHGFSAIEAVCRELESLSVPWCVAGGWSIDLALGEVTRVHHDCDILIARDDQLVVQEFMTDRGWKFVAPYEDMLGPWPPRMRLELPHHQAHAHRAGEFIDFLIGEIGEGVWRFRKNASVTRTLERAILRTRAGIPTIAPEIALLHKSRNTDPKRSKDAEDFHKFYSRLEPERRAWLRWALTVITPDHPWIALLV